MDVLRLDPETYIPNKLIEGYNSMIWAERYFDYGDFKMTTPLIEETRSLLPEGSLISHLETDVPMIVENHVIQKNDMGVPTLTISGRTLDCFSDERTMVGITHGEEWASLRPYTIPEVTTLLLWNYLVNSTGEDVTRPSGYSISPRNSIPNFVVTDSTGLSGESVSRFFEWGELSGQLRGFLDLGSLGVRVIRPSKSSGNVVSFDVSSENRGVRQTEFHAGISEMRFDIYSGVDRTIDQTDRPSVLFHYDFGDIDSPEYLFSIKDHKNLAVVYSDIGTFEIWPETGLTPPTTIPTGMNLRVIPIDGGGVESRKPELPPYPSLPPEATQQEIDEADYEWRQEKIAYDQEMVEYQQTLALFEESLIQKGLMELKKHARSTIFDGAIAPTSSHKYGVDYALGDRVTLSAEYGFSASMIVSEYVRTEDTAGDRGYPTLILAS